MPVKFEIASGKVLGRSHFLKQTNCQDAAIVLRGEGDIIVPVVCDGCSSGKHSEIGAQIGAHFVSEAVLNAATAYPTTDRGEFWELVRIDCFERIASVVRQMPGKAADLIFDHFLFAIVGALITPERTEFFAIGDGNVIVNGTRYELGPFPGNRPPYLAYGMGSTSFDSQELMFRIVASLPTAELNDFLIATDGLEDFIAAEGKCFPGMKEAIGPVSQFWTQDKYFRNSDMVRRTLYRANTEHVAIDWQAKKMTVHPGHLKDDLVIVSGRQKQEPSS